jgi:hypothetical protein
MSPLSRDFLPSRQRRHLAVLPFLGAILLLALASNAGLAAQPDPAAAVRRYNEACLLSLRGDTAGALQAFSQALEMGFDHIHHAGEDPDLANLRDHPEFARLIAARQAELQLLAAERGLTLESGRWSDFISLESKDAGEGPRLRVRWRPEGLDFELHLSGSWAGIQDSAMPPPWSGGFALVLTVAAPDTGLSYQSAGNFVLAFGLEKSTPVGGFHVPRAGWQRVLELDPDLRLASDTAVLAGTVPWQACRPFHPLADQRLGINAAVRVPRPEGTLVAELLPDPAAFRPEERVRRNVPLRFAQESETAESLAGRVSTSVASGLPLEVGLNAVSTRQGQAALTLDFTDSQGRSVLGDTPRGGALELDQGLNRISRQADLSRLRPGLYTIRAELFFPSGATGIWTTRVLHLGSGWPTGFTDRLGKLAADEQPTARYYLDAIDEALALLAPRFDPGPIATTLNDLDRILTRAEQTGTILPDQGPMLVVLTAEDGGQVPCTLFLPPGDGRGASLNPVLMMADMPGFEPRLADRVGRWYLDSDQLSRQERTTPHRPIFLVPHLGESAAGNLERQLQAGRLALDWACRRFSVDRVSVCGVDRAAGAALLLAVEQPDRIRALQVLAGGHLEPWPQATDRFLMDRLQPVPPDLPVTWQNFEQETAAGGQANQLLTVMRRLGFRIVAEQAVRGGMSFSQVADRTVLWAETIP